MDEILRRYQHVSERDVLSVADLSGPLHFAEFVGWFFTADGSIAPSVQSILESFPEPPRDSNGSVLIGPFSFFTEALRMCKVFDSLQVD